jgi:hypothetical protein
MFSRGPWWPRRLLYATWSVASAIIVCMADRVLYGFDYVILSNGVRDGTNLLSWWL